MRGLEFSGEVVAIAGRLTTMTADEAAAAIRAAGGDVDAMPTARTSVIVVSTADERAPVAALAPRASVIDEDALCDRLGRVGPSSLRQHHHPLRALKTRYPLLKADQLRLLEHWGLLRGIVRTPHETYFSFADVAVIRQAHAELERGVAFKQMLRTLMAEREGQLALDFRPAHSDSQPAKVVALAPRARVPAARPLFEPATVVAMRSPAEAKVLEATTMDVGPSADIAAAMSAYRAALDMDPDLVPAMINLGNLHYLRDQFAEAHALYFQAAIVDPECYEAHFNLGNIAHDRGRYEDAAASYGEALRLRPQHADAHFYLAVTLEKLGRAQGARPHWRAYQQLAPDGEWIELAREFADET